MQRRPALHLLKASALLSLVVMTATAQTRDPSAPAELTDVLDRAARQFEQQDYAAARRSYEQATVIDPGSLRAWRGYGWSLWQLGQQDRALKIWNDLIKVQPDDSGTLFALAHAHELRENFEMAMQLYGRVLKRSPRYRPALMGRARINRQLERHAAAEADLMKVIGLHPADFEAQFMLAQTYRDTGRLDEAMHLYEQLARRDPDPKYLRPLADMLLGLNRPREAIEYYQRNLKQAPDNRGTLLGLARAHVSLHEYQPAIGYLEQYLDHHPDDAKIREELARFARDAGDYEKSEQHQRILVRDHPEEIKWRLSLAHILQSAGKIDEPLEIARKVLDEDSDNVAALEILLDNANFSGRTEEAIQWLERLVAIEPTAKRMSRLGDLHIQLAEEHQANNQPGQAQAAYEKSVSIFRQASEAYPNNPDALLGTATALRLAGRYAEAIEAAERVRARYPAVERARREAYLSRLELDDFAGARKALIPTLEVFPGNIRLEQDYAEVRFKSGEREAAIQQLKKLLEVPIDPSVPVLLYHGVSRASTREDTMPVSNFRDQMQMLKREGYQSISVHQLIDFYEGGGNLPPKPVLITFDDARADSFRYADPVLEETGFQATMFVPVAEVGMHGAFNAVWDTIHRMYRSGRWDIQCHSNKAHVPIVVDAEGTEGYFLANRMWLEEENRLESRQEFVTRLEEDYRSCGEELVKQLPGLKLAGYSYPFGEMGQKSFSNEPDAVAINNTLAIKYFKVAFLQDPAADVTRATGPAVFPRLEVPWNFTGAELLDHIRGINAYGSTQLLLADLYASDGQYAEAQAIFQSLSGSDRVDRTALLTRQGRVAMWQGDFVQARQHLSAAAEAEPENTVARQSLEQLDQRLRPSLTVEGLDYSDNQDRSSFSIGPSYKLHLSDRLALTTAYNQRRIEHDDFNTALVDPGSTLGAADLRATGDEIEARFEYRWNWRTQLTGSFGLAKFDNDSSARFLGRSRTFPLASLSLSFPRGNDTDIFLQLRHDYLNAAGAILDDLESTSAEGRVEHRFLEDMTFEGRLIHSRYDDGNSRSTAILGVFKNVHEKPDVQVGYRFMYDDTREQNPFFYTPDGFIGNDVVARLESKPRDDLSLALEASVGIGREDGESQTQTSLIGTGRFRLNDRFSIYFGGGRSQSANFRSNQLSAGVTVMF